MELNLRTARRLENEIKNQTVKLIAQLGNTTTVTPNEVGSINNCIIEAEKQVIDEVTKITNLQRIRYDIRRSIEKANENIGLNLLMNEEQVLKENLQTLSQIVDERYVVTDKELNRAVEQLDAIQKQRDGGSTSSYIRREVAVNILSQSMFSELQLKVRTIKRRLDEIADQCSSLNGSFKIAISAEDASYLTEVGIL